MRFLQIIIKKTQIRQVYLIVNIVLSAKITKSMKISLDVLSLSPGLQWLDLCRPKKAFRDFGWWHTKEACKLVWRLPCKAHDAYQFTGWKYFTNSCLRIDFFRPRCLLVGNDAIMGCFDNLLNINQLRFWWLLDVIFVLKSRRRYTVTASRLHRNGDAITP